MNIIIPIGGLGSRFSIENYRMPKPLVMALGKPILYWTLENLFPQEDDQLYIIYRNEFKVLDFEEKIKSNFPKYNINFISINYDTRGAAETVLHTFEKINESRLIDLTIVIDSDNFYDIDIISKAKNYNTNSIFYIKNSNPLPLFSYILIDNNDNVTSIKEKIKISDNACVGAYCFKSANFLKQLIESVIYKNKTQKNEFYISNLYDEILDLNDNIKGIEINKFNCLGTPKQLMDFCIENIEHTRFNNIYVQIDISDLFDNGSENENYLNISEDIFHLLDKIIALGIKIDFYVNKNISDIDIKNKILILDQKSTNVNYRFLNADIFKYSLRFKLTKSTTSADIEKELGLYFNKNYIHDK